MKLKKLLTGAAALTMTVFLLAACGSKDDSSSSSSSSETATSETTKESSKEDDSEKSDVKLVDGTYKLEEKNYKNGYRVVFDIVVKDGKIVESNYDNVNEKGESKKDDEEYNKSMEEKSGSSPEKYIPELNEELVKAQNPSDVEVVTGATHSSEDFKEYAEKLFEAAEKGDTKTIEIDNKVD